MKKRMSLFLVGSFLIMIPKISWAVAEDEIFFSRSPILSQQTLDSDIRLRSMGGLSLPVVDDANMIGIFKYGNNPAGLSLDYLSSKIEGGLGYESGKLKDKGTVDDSFQGTIFDAKQSFFQSLGVGHIKQSEESEGSFAFHVGHETDKADYDSSYLNGSGVDSVNNKSVFTTLFAGYGHRFGNFLAGLSVSSRDETPTDLEITSGGTTDKEKYELKTTEIFPSIGYIFSLPNESRLVASIGPRIQKNKTETSDTSVPESSSDDTDGTFLNTGLVFSHGENLKAAFMVDTGKLKGDRATGGGTSSSEEKLTNYKLRLYSKPENLPISFGAEYSSSKDNDETSQAGVKTNDNETLDKDLGLGIAAHFSENKGLIGIEYNDMNSEHTDIFTPSLNNESNGHQISLGGKYSFLPTFTGRAGIRKKSLAYQETGTPELKTDTFEIDLGGELTFGWGSFALLYSNITAENDSDAILVQDKHEYSGNNLSLLVTYLFGSGT